MKYEDLVSQPKEMAVKLYRFINASEDIDYALQYLESHYKKDQPTSKYVSGTLTFLRFELFVSETFFSGYFFKCILNQGYRNRYNLKRNFICFEKYP